MSVPKSRAGSDDPAKTILSSLTRFWGPVLAKEPTGHGETWAKAMQGGEVHVVGSVMSLVCCKPRFFFLLPVF